MASREDCETLVIRLIELIEYYVKLKKMMDELDVATLLSRRYGGDKAVPFLVEASGELGFRAYDIEKELRELLKKLPKVCKE